jgi:hypothetical protein
MSAVAPIADKLGLGLIVRYVSIADSCTAANSIQGGKLVSGLARLSAGDPPSDLPERCRRRRVIAMTARAVGARSHNRLALSVA